MKPWNTPKRIIWALDAFDNSPETREHVTETLRLFAGAMRLEVEPVYVLSPDQLDVPTEVGPMWSDHYRPAAEKALQAAVIKAEIPGMLPPKVLTHNQPSLTSSVHVLHEYARTSGKDLIIVATHGRKGLQRMMMGSFAETLLLQAQVPVLVVGSREEPTHDVRNILFPTDFGESSQAAFERAIEWAKSVGGGGVNAKLTLYHAIPRPIEPVFQSGVYLLGGAWVPVPEFFKTEEARQREIAHQWIEKAKRLGVPAEAVVETAEAGVVASVLDYARKHEIGMIMMAAQSGRVATALLGSIARQVVRSAPCPVLVMRNGKS